MNTIKILMVAGYILAMTSVQAITKDTNAITTRQNNTTTSTEISSDEIEKNGKDIKVVTRKRAINDFENQFKNIHKLLWAESSEGLTASFFEDGIQHTVFYNKMGGWQGTMKSYTENKMPGLIRELVRQENKLTTIIYADEITTALSEHYISYIIHFGNGGKMKLKIHKKELPRVWEEFANN